MLYSNYKLYKKETDLIKKDEPAPLKQTQEVSKIEQPLPNLVLC